MTGFSTKKLVYFLVILFSLIPFVVFEYVNACISYLITIVCDFLKCFFDDSNQTIFWQRLKEPFLGCLVFHAQ